MQNIQEIFDRIQTHKKEQKELKTAYKDALNASAPHKKIVEDIKELREKKKKMEFSIKEDFTSEFTKLEALEVDIASDMEILNDLAISQLMRGEPVAVTDQYQNSYDPIFSVRFKKK